MRGVRPDPDPHPAVRFVMAKRPSDVQGGPGFFDDIDEPDRPTSGRRLIVEADGGSAATRDQLHTEHWYATPRRRKSWRPKVCPLDGRRTMLRSTAV